MRVGAGGRYNAGIGAISIPSNIDRDQYIGRVFRMGRVMVQDNSGPTIYQAVISKAVMSQLVFPDTDEELGSSVVWINVPFSNTVVIVAVLNSADEMELLSENEFVIGRDTDESSVTIKGNGATGELFISAQGSKGNIHLDSDGDFNINVTGKYVKNIAGDSEISIDGSETKTLVGAYNVKSDDGYNFGDAKEPAVLGDTLQGVIEDLIDYVEAVNKATETGIATAGGTYVAAPMTLLSEAIKLTLADIKSQNFKLD